MDDRDPFLLMTRYPFISELLALVGEAVYLCDAEGQLIYMNAAAEKLDGFSFSAIRGRTIRELYGLDDTPMLRALRTGRPVENVAFRYNVNGLEVFQICNARPIVSGGRVAGAYTIQRDITRLKEVVEHNLRMQRELFPTTISDSDIDNLLTTKGFPDLVGEHPKFRECLDMARMAAERNSHVMLTGKTGTGKELFAKTIHHLSPRRSRPFLAINCAAIPEALLEGILFGTAKGVYTGAVERKGLFEEAEGGTLFLDEINSMTLYSQSKLLRVLEEKETRHLGGKERIKIDVRIVSGINVPPREAIRLGQIREDLFYRLAVVNIVIPDLAARPSDIPLLADHFIAHYNEDFGKSVQGLSEEVREFFLEYPWPGNVRQLRHCLESAMNFVGPHDRRIRKEHLPQYLFGVGFQGFSTYDRPEEMWPAAPVPAALAPGTLAPVAPAPDRDEADGGLFAAIRDQDRRRVVEALKASCGNVSQAARTLNMHRQSLVHRIKKYGLK